MKQLDKWKEAYKPYRKQAMEKEEAFRQLFEACTGWSLSPFGLGAESEEDYPGRSERYGIESNAPDYQIEGTDIFIEVTGPIADHANPANGLWIRPGKLNYAFRHRKDQSEYIVLFYPYNKGWYVIHANDAFFQHAKENPSQYKRRQVGIRGEQETYIQISCDNPHVKGLDQLMEEICCTLQLPKT